MITYTIVDGEAYQGKFSQGWMYRMGARVLNSFLTADLGKHGKISCSNDSKDEASAEGVLELMKANLAKAIRIKLNKPVTPTG